MRGRHEAAKPSQSQGDGPGGSARPRPRPVWLVGMMGAGKSTLGPLVAAALERRFVDTDQHIVETAGHSVQEIFEREGEAGFRARERAAIAAAAEQCAVTALGGGAIAQPGAAEQLAALGTVVYLRAQPDTLMARIGTGAQRPLLAGLSTSQRRARVVELLAEREPAYASAQLIVDVDSWAADPIAEHIAARVRELEAGAGVRAETEAAAAAQRPPSGEKR